jgi:hypothetical protein
MGYDFIVRHLCQHFLAYLVAGGRVAPPTSGSLIDLWR